jgi:hypothetical protein
MRRGRKKIASIHIANQKHLKDIRRRRRLVEATKIDTPEFISITDLIALKMRTAPDKQNAITNLYANFTSALASFFASLYLRRCVYVYFMHDL